MVRGLLLLLAPFAASAAAPTLDHLLPAGGQQGTTVTVNVVGKTDPWPPQVWTSAPGLAFKPDKDKGRFTVEIAKNAAPGPHLVRLYNDDGASALRFFLVSRTREEQDKEPNDAFATPQPAGALPVILNGRLDKRGDVDSFAVDLRTGEWLVASMDAFRLFSTMDALLRITDTNGVTHAFNHDGRTFDPFLAWQAPATGTYVVQVMAFPYPANASVNLAGGNGYIYRLTLTTGPWLDHAFPPALPRGQKATLQLIGWNLARDTRKVEFPYIPSPARQRDGLVEVTWKTALNSLQVPLSALAEHTDTEPNNTREEAQQLTPPAAVNGRIHAAGDEDRFAFEVKKGDKLLLAVKAVALGFPLDAWLRVEDAGGREQKKSDDEGNAPDPSLEWTAPNDGTFFAVVGSVFSSGGDDQAYRLEITRPSPAFNATIGAHALAIEPGKTNDVKVNVTRLHGHDRKLTLSAKGLPAGVTLAPVEAPAKNGEVTLKLVAGTDAKPHNGLLQVLITEDGQPPRPVIHELTGRGIDNGVPQGHTNLVIEQTEQLWLAVLAKKEEKK
jgi:hypothetical protein